MPIKKDTSKYLTFVSTQSAAAIIDQIRERIKGFIDLNKDVNIGEVLNALDDAQKKVEEIQTEWCLLKSELTLKQINILWREFVRHLNGNITNEVKEKYRELLKTTKDYFTNLELSSFGLPQGSTRTKSEQNEQTRLEVLKEKREEVKKALVLAQNEDPRDEDKIRKLRLQLLKLEGTYVQTKKTLDDLKSDSAEEEQVRNKIDDAFGFLGQDNHLESELKKLQAEYYVMLICIVVIITLFCLFYGWFIGHLQALKLEEWHDYLPYTMVVPITIGLLWLFVYLKNRASKLSLELNTKLYDLKYMEGLMKMTNSMSRSSDEAFNSIGGIVKELVSSFIRKISDQSFKEKDLSAIEKRELEDSPYWKVLKELKELIKLIRK